jgi:hypothetical protein
MEGENFQHLPQGGDCMGTTMASIGSTTPARRSTGAAALLLATEMHCSRPYIGKYGDR